MRAQQPVLQPPAKVTQQQQQPLEVVGSQVASRSQRALARARHAPPLPFGDAPQPPPPVSTSVTGSRRRHADPEESLRERERRQSMQSVRVGHLEAELLQQNQTRDGLISDLQKLEGQRFRGVADRARQAAMEQDLEAIEKNIGRVRMELRQLTMLKK